MQQGAPRPADRRKPSVDAENAGRASGGTPVRPDAGAPPAEPQRPAPGTASREVPGPVASGNAAPRKPAAGAAAAVKPSAVREPQPVTEQPAEAEPAQQPVAQPAAQPPEAKPPAGSQPGAGTRASAGTDAPVESAAPSAVSTGAESEVAVAGPPRQPRIKKRKGPAPGAVRPLEHPRQRVDVVLAINDLAKRFGTTTAVAGITLQVRAGTFFGLVGPNGAGKTTTLSMVTGLLRPDAGSVMVHGADVWSNPVVAKRNMGVLPDSLRLFDRLTGAQLLYYAGVLRGLDAPTVQSRTLDLAEAFGLTDALDRLVTDYSAGMTKKIALAAAMIHSPRLLVLDEPFESVDPVSAANVTEILQRYVAAGGTVVLSSHSMDLIQRICDDVAIVVNGRILASGPVDRVRGEGSLEERFVELAGGRRAAEGMEWLHSFSE